MTYEPKTIKVDLGGGNGFGPFKGKGNYAVIYQDLRHGTQRSVNELTRPLMQFPDGKPPKLTLGQDGPTVQGATAVEIDLDKVDFDAVNDLIIIGQVKEWTFGPVDQETLDDIPEKVRAVLVQKVNELFGAAVPLAHSGDGN